MFRARRPKVNNQQIRKLIACFRWELCVQIALAAGFFANHMITATKQRNIAQAARLIKMPSVDEINNSITCVNSRRTIHVSFLSARHSCLQFTCTQISSQQQRNYENFTFLGLVRETFTPRNAVKCFLWKYLPHWVRFISLAIFRSQTAGHATPLIRQALLAQGVYFTPARTDNLHNF
jgi:hypothetical protein